MVGHLAELRLQQLASGAEATELICTSMRGKGTLQGVCGAVSVICPERIGPRWLPKSGPSCQRLPTVTLR